MQTLKQLPVGSHGRVIKFQPGTKAYRQKLLAMGMLPGTEFTITRIAPLGDPIELSVRGYALSLRKEEAESLAVELIKS